MSADSAHQEEESSTTGNTSESPLVSPTHQPTKRINSIRLRRTNSSRIRKFKVMLDSDEENGN